MTDEARAAFALFTDRFADGLKLIGTANGAALLATIVAVTNFQKPEQLEFFKRLSLSYLGGLLVFVLAYVVFMWFLTTQTPDFYGRTQYEPTFRSPLFTLALWLGGASLGAFVYATIRVAIMMMKYTR